MTIDYRTLLVDYPFVTVRFACSNCKRRGQVRVAKIAEAHGAEITMCQVLGHLVENCSRWHWRFGDGGEPCGAYLTGLLDNDPQQRPPPVLRLVQ